MSDLWAPRMGLHHCSANRGLWWNLIHWTTVFISYLLYFQDLFVFVSRLESLVPFPHCLICKLDAIPLLSNPARTSFFNVPCDLSASERGKQPPVSCQTHTHPTRYWKQIHDWRRRRHEFMSTIDSCRWDLLYVFPLKEQAHLKIYFSVFKQRSVGHTQCMERYASISSKLHHLSFITQQPTKSIGTLKTHKNVQMSNVKQHQVRSFLLTSLAVTSSFTMFENYQMSKYVNFVQYIYCFMHNVKLVHFLYIDATKNILFEKTKSIYGSMFENHNIQIQFSSFWSVYLLFNYKNSAVFLL